MNIILNVGVQSIDTNAEVNYNTAVMFSCEFYDRWIEQKICDFCDAICKFY
jgi:hypothetical protein